jgi:hypothetical protein
MNLQGMINKDLAACFNIGEFGIEATHFFGVASSEVLNVVFDETTDVVLERGEYAGVETTVPALQVSTSLAANINHKSLFIIGANTFGVIEVHKQNDSTTKVYLDRQ